MSGALSPRKKAIKGRFGAGGVAPSIAQVTPPSGYVVTTGVGFAASAVASDDIDGDISASLDWFSDLDAASVGTGGTPTITLTALGTHTLTLTATATTGGATKTTQVKFVVVAP